MDRKKCILKRAAINGSNSDTTQDNIYLRQRSGKGLVTDVISKDNNNDEFRLNSSS